MTCALFMHRAVHRMQSILLRKLNKIMSCNNLASGTKWNCSSGGRGLMLILVHSDKAPNFRIKFY